MCAVRDVLGERLASLQLSRTSQQRLTTCTYIPRCTHCRLADQQVLFCACHCNAPHTAGRSTCSMQRWQLQSILNQKATANCTYRENCMQIGCQGSLQQESKILSQHIIHVARHMLQHPHALEEKAASLAASADAAARSIPQCRCFCCFCCYSGWLLQQRSSQPLGPAAPTQWCYPNPACGEECIRLCWCCCCCCCLGVSITAAATAAVTTAPIWQQRLQVRWQLLCHG
jgi:hypothetical protein